MQGFMGVVAKSSVSTSSDARGVWIFSAEETFSLSRGSTTQMQLDWKMNKGTMLGWSMITDTGNATCHEKQPLFVK